MSLYSLWKHSPQQVRQKQVSQLIAFAGGGRLKDGGAASEEFRELLLNVPSDLVKRHVEDCLASPFQDSGLALQDVLNEVGRRLGFTVTNGRYRGVPGEVGFDGLWKAGEGLEIVVEVKTTDAYRMDLNTIAAYRKQLIDRGEISEETSSILIVVGRHDTGDLEAQIRGSKHAWDIRLISADAILRLLSIKEEVEDPAVSTRIRSILVPREYTRVDDIIELVFSTTEDLKQEDTVVAGKEKPEEGQGPKPKFSPVQFNEACAERVASRLGVDLIRRSRAFFTTADESTGSLCAVSREYDNKTSLGYWFSFHAHQAEWLENVVDGYVSFGCGSPAKVALVPYGTFRNWVQGLNQTTRDNGAVYWHVQIHDEDGEILLRRKEGFDPIHLAKYLLPVDGDR